MSGKPTMRLSALMATTALVAAALSTPLLFTAPAWAQDEAAEDAAPAAEGEREVITVRGQFIPDEKRETSEISSVVDAEDFAIRGDSDVAAALQRVTGLSLSQGKFIFARGLNERYSNATLNGSPLPSPEPLRRVAPLDIFPTSILASTLAQKTYSPEYSLEFGGAVVDLRTKAIPNERFFDVGFGVSANSATHGDTGLLYDGGDLDWLGIDDGGRNRPGALADIRGVTRVGPSLTAEERQEIGRSLDNDASYWVIQEGDIAPNGSLSASAGDRYDLASWLSVGVLASGGYSSEWQTREGIRSIPRLVGGELEASETFDRFSTQNNVNLNGLASVGFDILDNHEVKFTAVGVRSTEKEARTSIGAAVETGGRIRRQEFLEWFERQLWTTQAAGESYLPWLGDLQVNWRASYSEATRDAPYQRFAEYSQRDDGLFRYEGESSSNSTQFSYILDDTTDLGIDLMWPITIGGMDIELKGGYAYVEKDRRSDQQFLRYSEVTGDLLDQRIDLIFTDNNIVSPGGIELIEIGGSVSPEAYIATLEVDAAYAQIDAQVTPFLRLAVGGRYEDAIEATDIFNLTDDPAQNTVEGVIENDYFLPAATATWNVLDNVQVRVAYSQTINRPQFRELAGAIFFDSETDLRFVGNPFLTDSEVENYDARLEWYFARDQFLTLGVFSKDILNPIEEILTPVGDGELQTTFVNSPSASLQGVEVEFERVFDLSTWFDQGFLSTKDGVIRTNYTYTTSEVDANGDIIINAGTAVSPNAQTVDAQTRISDGRALTGQSEHLFNLQFGYEDYEARSRAMFLVNYASDRFRNGENLSIPLPAITESPPTIVDFVYSREFDVLRGTFEFGFKASNLFDDDYEAFQEQGGVVVPIDTYKIGQTYSLSLKARY